RFSRDWSSDVCSSDLDPEQARGRGDASRDGLGRADVERTVLGLPVEVLARHPAAPAALRADPLVHLLVVREELLARLLVGLCDVARRVQADRQRRLAELRERAAVEVR